MNKKGLSDVITTVLIILLVLAAVVIIWSFVRPAIQSGASKVTGACISLDLKVISCNSTAVIVERGADPTTLEEVVLVYDKADGSSGTVLTSKSLNQLERKAFAYDMSNASKVTVTGKVKTEAGELMLCQPTSVKIACI